MPWIALLALLMIAMLLVSVMGAEWNFRRSLERRARIQARLERRAARC